MYSRTSLQRTSKGPGLTVRPTGVRSFAGVLMEAASGRRGGGVKGDCVVKAKGTLPLSNVLVHITMYHDISWSIMKKVEVFPFWVHWKTIKIRVVMWFFCQGWIIVDKTSAFSSREGGGQVPLIPPLPGASTPQFISAHGYLTLLLVQKVQSSKVPPVAGSARPAAPLKFELYALTVTKEQCYPHDLYHTDPDRQRLTLSELIMRCIVCMTPRTQFTAAAPYFRACKSGSPFENYYAF